MYGYARTAQELAEEEKRSESRTVAIEYLVSLIKDDSQPRPLQIEAAKILLGGCW